MLRPANDALRTRKSATGIAIVVLAFAMLIPCVAALSACFVSEAARSYLGAYRPVVYLHADVGQAQAQALTDELGGWPSVARAEVRTPAGAFADLEDRLGAEELVKLGVDADMLPFSVELVPATPIIGHLDLMARISGLQARPMVASIDIPSAKAARGLSAVRWLLIAAALLLVVAVTTGVGQTRWFLVCVAEEHARETALLAQFGAPPARLSRPTMIRGVSVGLLAAAVASGGLFALLLLWHSARPDILGLSGGLSLWPWAVVIAPLVLGPGAGAASAWLANKNLRDANQFDDLQLQILVADA